MKILHINDYRDAGGCEVIVQLTAALLEERGLCVDIFTCDDVPDYKRTPLGYITSNICSKTLAEILQSKKPDIVHLHNFYHELSPGILKTLADYKRNHDVKVVMTAHDYHLVCPNSGLNYFSHGKLQMADVAHLRSLIYILTKRWDERSIAHSLLKLAQHIYNYRLLKRHKVIDLVLCPSKYIQSVLSSTGLKTKHIPLPAPGAANTSDRAEAPLSFVFAGRVEPEKGLAQFLENIPDDLQGKFVVIGEGSELQRCRDIVSQRQLSLDVDFVGKRPHDETLSIISKSHVLVLPSVCAENYPLSMLEALASQTNVLVSSFGGMREIVDQSGIGFMFDPNDSSSLHLAIENVVKSFSAGSINQFEVSGFLADRDEKSYIDQILEVYGYEQAAITKSLDPVA